MTQSSNLASVYRALLCLGLASVSLLAHSEPPRQQQVNPKPHRKVLLVIGDSVATGAVSSEYLTATIPSLAFNAWTRGRNNPKETDWGVNFPENSFAQTIASFLGYRYVVNAAVNGRRVQTIYEQYSGARAHLGGNPDTVVISYTANDVCDPSIFERSESEFRSSYQRELMHGSDGQSGLLRVLKELEDTKPIRVLYLASLNFNQILTSPSILNHQVTTGTLSKGTCLSFRNGHQTFLEPGLVAKRLTKMCPSILETDPVSADLNQVRRRSQLSKMHEAMLEAQHLAIAEVAQTLPKNVSIHYLHSPGYLRFEGNHIANDCFHLSRQGQNHLALKIWTELYDLLILK